MSDIDEKLDRLRAARARRAESVYSQLAALQAENSGLREQVGELRAERDRYKQALQFIATYDDFYTEGRLEECIDAALKGLDQENKMSDEK